MSSASLENELRRQRFLDEVACARALGALAATVRGDTTHPEMMSRLLLRVDEQQRQDLRAASHLLLGLHVSTATAAEIWESTRRAAAEARETEVADAAFCAIGAAYLAVENFILAYNEPVRMLVEPGRFDQLLAAAWLACCPPDAWGGSMQSKIKSAVGLLSPSTSIEKAIARWLQMSVEDTVLCPDVCFLDFPLN